MDRKPIGLHLELSALKLSSLFLLSFRNCEGNEYLAWIHHLKMYILNGAEDLKGPQLEISLVFQYL